MIVDIFCSYSGYFGIVLRMVGLLLAFPLLRYITKFISAAVAKRFSQHMGIVVGHVIFYSGLAFIVVNILHEFGFNVTALIGAAGIVGVAIGFASQTSVSNIISGFFLLMERPFSVGDMIKSGEIVGVAESIDLLAVKVRTLDNKLVRIPNEMVLKHALTNLTYYPIKRIDLIMSVPYQENSDDIANLVREVVESNKIFLTNPAPVCLLNKIAQQELSTEMRLFFSVRVWTSKEYFSSAANILMMQLKNHCDKHNKQMTISQVN